nr:unknown [Pieris rapae granulovirus]
MKRSVANWVIEKHQCTEKEKRLRNLLITNSGLKLEGGKWLDKRIDLNAIDTEELLIKVLKAMNEQNMRFRTNDDDNDENIYDDEGNIVSVSKNNNVTRETKRLFTKRPNFTDIKSVREFILQMGRTIIACNPSLQYLNEDFSYLAFNYGLAQDTPVVENEKLKRELRDAVLAKQNESKRSENIIRQMENTIKQFDDTIKRQNLELTANKKEINQLKNDITKTNKNFDNLQNKYTLLLENVNLNESDQTIENLQQNLKVCEQKFSNLLNEYNRIKEKEAESLKAIQNFEMLNEKLNKQLEENKNTITRLLAGQTSSENKNAKDLDNEKQQTKRLVKEAEMRCEELLKNEKENYEKILSAEKQKYTAFMKQYESLTEKNKKLEQKQIQLINVHNELYAGIEREIKAREKDVTFPDAPILPTTSTTSISNTSHIIGLIGRTFGLNVVTEQKIENALQQLTGNLQKMHQSLNCSKNTNLTPMANFEQCIDEIKKRLVEYQDNVYSAAKNCEIEKSKIKAQCNDTEESQKNYYLEIVKNLKSNIEIQLTNITSEHNLYEETKRLLVYIGQLSNKRVTFENENMLTIYNVTNGIQNLSSVPANNEFLNKLLSTLKSCFNFDINDVLNNLQNQTEFINSLSVFCNKTVAPAAGIKRTNDDLQNSTKKRVAIQQSTPLTDKSAVASSYFSEPSTSRGSYLEYKDMEAVIERYSEPQNLQDLQNIENDPDFIAIDKKNLERQRQINLVKKREKQIDRDLTDKKFIKRRENIKLPQERDLLEQRIKNRSTKLTKEDEFVVRTDRDSSESDTSD